MKQTEEMIWNSETVPHESGEPFLWSYSSFSSSSNKMLFGKQRFDEPTALFRPKVLFTPLNPAGISGRSLFRLPL
ncbi:hypothetical protein EQM14_04690 [Caproiciproducens sp. NJN-50]|uniref:hypothetical protein n=1 Tax=Acutalibacteraceae TaxID=3082771 RepID=UPI000FFE0B3C|nr:MULTISPECIES: hypothetical protein [Acutalibacteraceae]QAT49126.1 hypothetical protein EQM14_04690 [Caproiciproducens sp. NJN-50]